MEFVPPFAPIVVLTFLGTALLLALGAAVFLYAVLFKRQRLVGPIALALVGVMALYAAALLVSSALSRERVLQPRGKKYFCEIDCHLAYSVERVEVAKELGAPPAAVRAAGAFHVVTLRTWFDEHTISSRRARGMPLRPNPRVVFIRDEEGRRYDSSPAAQAALVATGRSSTPLTEALRPGESYLTCLVFHLPNDVRSPRLFVGSAPGVEFLLIGHEMSPLHKKVWFALAEG